MKIQCAFRIFISKKCLARKRVDMQLYRKHCSVIKIQAVSRRVAARVWTLKMATLEKFNVRNRAASLLQRTIRAFLSRRRLSRRRLRFQWVAARMIQCWFRSIRARRLCFIMRKRTLQWRQFFATRKFQCAIRKFLSRRRMKRINERAKYVLRFNSVTRIQKRIRGWLARSRVCKIRIEVQNQKILTAKKLKNEEDATNAIAEQTANMELLQSVNIFYQARAGRIVEVDDIFHGRVTDEAQSVTDTDAVGDSVLTIAASMGNAELCRKCLLWGFSVNHRNVKGQTPLIAAVVNCHPEVVQYLLQAGKETMEPISRDDAGLMLVAAASGATEASREILRTLLAQELSPSCASPESGMTALHSACEAGDIQAVQMLLKLRASVDAVDDMGQTPLHKACKASLELFSLLLLPANNPDAAMSVSMESMPTASSSSSSSEPVSTPNTQSATGPTPTEGLPPMISSLPRGQSSMVPVDTTGSVEPNATAALIDPINLHVNTDWRVSKILKTDIDGKDCFLLSILCGNNDILTEIGSILSSAQVVRMAPEEIGWSPNDIAAAHKLVESNNYSCLDQLIAQGFDVSWVLEDNGVTLAMTACKFGSLTVLDMLLELKVDLTVTDSLLRRSVMHYAATCKTESVMAYLLTHAMAKDCKLIESSLCSQDINGHTPIHVAAIEGVDFSLDLIARQGIDGAISTVDKDGLTPLMLACSYLQLNVVTRLLELGSDPKIVDTLGHDSLWHLYHPHISTLARPRPIIGSEFASRTKPADTITYPGGVVTRREDAIRVAEDLDVVIAIVRKGCMLYHNRLGNMKETEQFLLGAHPAMYSANNNDITEECGDILVREKSVVLMRSLASICSVADSWRLLMACMRFDVDTSSTSSVSANVCLKTLIEGGITQAIVKSSVTSDTAIDAVIDILSKSAPQVTVSRPTTPKLQSTKDVFQNYKFNGRSLIAWAIFAKNYGVFEYLLSIGVNPTVPVDDDNNSCLHFVAKYGTSNMMALLLTNFPVSKAFSVVLSPKKGRIDPSSSSSNNNNSSLLLLSSAALASMSLFDSVSTTSLVSSTLAASWQILLEATNTRGRTAAMEAAIAGNIAVAKQLIIRKASARTALNARYYAALLALARRQERVEINTQTGITDADDLKYFCVAPDPSYTVWYK